MVVAALFASPTLRSLVLAKRFVHPNEAEGLQKAWERVHLVVLVKPAAHWRPGMLGQVLESAPKAFDFGQGVETLHVLATDDPASDDGERLAKLFAAGSSTVRRARGGRAFPATLRFSAPEAAFNEPALLSEHVGQVQVWNFYTAPAARSCVSSLLAPLSLALLPI